MTIRAPLYTRVARRHSPIPDVGQPTRLVQGQDAFPPGRGFASQNPRGAAFSVGLRTWVVGGLLLTTLAPPEAAPFSQADWPNPQHQLRVQPQEPANLLLTTLATPQQVPFRSSDFPNPRRARYPAQLLQWEDGIIELPWPFWQSDHPNPVRARAFTQRTWTQNLLQGTLAPAPGAPPFSQDEWPVPRGRTPAIALRTWTDATRPHLKDQFFGVAGQPPANLDWPNPRGARPAIVLRSWNLTLLQTTLAPVAPSPFVMHEWPVPKGEAHPVVLRTWLDPLRPHLRDTFFGVPGQPPANMDWPNPRGAAYAISLRGLAVNLMQGTLGPPPPLDDVRIRFTADRERSVFVAAREVQTFDVFEEH